jgi:hypothetical protein
MYTLKRIYIGVVKEAGRPRRNNNLLAQQECGSNCSVVQ